MADARALWVNPAGLGREHEASLHMDLTVDDPAADARLRQVTLGFNSRGLSFGYQRDSFDGGVRGHTYRVGLGAGRNGLAAGLAVALYRGDTKGTGWDLGVVCEPTARLALSAVLGNVQQPVVRGVRQVATLTPSLTLKPFGPLLAFSVEGRIDADSVLGYSAGARIRTPGHVPLGLLARLETDHALHRVAFVFGVSVGARGLVGAAASTSRDGSRVDVANLYAVTARTGGR